MAIIKEWCLGEQWKQDGSGMLRVQLYSSERNVQVLTHDTHECGIYLEMEPFQLYKLG